MDTIAREEVLLDAAVQSAPIPLRVLILEDNSRDAEFCIAELKRNGFAVRADVVDAEEPFVAKLQSATYDVILSDYRIPNWNGAEAFHRLKQSGKDIPFILVTGALGEETAVDLIRGGVTDYILKDRLVRLPSAVLRAIQEKMMRDERGRAIQALRDSEKRLLQKVDELNRTNKELEQLTYVASHDLQEPLRMVASYTQLLARRYKGKLDSDADEYIAFAVDGVMRIQRLIRDLLVYSRVGTEGKNPVETPSEEAFKRALSGLRRAIEESGALVTYDALPAVMADENQLIQLFEALIGNAVKYKGAEIPRIHVSSQKDGHGKCVFSIEDNGIGIAAQHFERIFGVFQRLHLRNEFEGTGIGLAVCKKIVERQGGSISVESHPGKGSIFRFTLLDADTNSEKP